MQRVAVTTPKDLIESLVDTAKETDGDGLAAPTLLNCQDHESELVPLPDDHQEYLSGQPLLDKLRVEFEKQIAKRQQ